MADNKDDDAACACPRHQVLSLYLGLDDDARDNFIEEILEDTLWTIGVADVKENAFASNAGNVIEAIRSSYPDETEDMSDKQVLETAVGAMIESFAMLNMIHHQMSESAAMLQLMSAPGGSEYVN